MTILSYLSYYAKIINKQLQREINFNVLRDLKENVMKQKMNIGVRDLILSKRIQRISSKSNFDR